MNFEKRFYASLLLQKEAATEQKNTSTSKLCSHLSRKLRSQPRHSTQKFGSSVYIDTEACTR
jgi:hypothetical protein